MTEINQAVALIQTRIRSLRKTLPDGSAEFLERVYSGGLERYDNRLRRYGFAGRKRMLDAGAGFGQWSLALAGMVDRVDALDCAADRISVVSALADAAQLENVHPCVGDLERLPYPDQSFDGVLCFSVLQAVRRRECCAEFRRVLAPGGVLAATVNGLGHYLHMWQERPNASAAYDPRRHAAEAMMNALRYEDGSAPLGGMAADPKEFEAELRALGFASVSIGPEGSLLGPGGMGRPDSFFLGEYSGFPGVYEVVAIV